MFTYVICLFYICKAYIVKHKILFITLFLFYLTAGVKSESRPIRLSKKARISILTCSPGEELYSVFGHSAIRVSDPPNQIDLAFNYGTFDFNTPFFYLKFGHGSLDYLLSVSSFKRFMREYFMEGRSVWEQQLDLSAEQKQDLFEALIVNAQPENRAYEYDFFYDNCATRVAHIVIDELPEPKRFTAQIPSTRLTFRQAIHPYLKRKPWTKIGLDLILGAPADAPTDSMTIMFLPDYLMEQFQGLQYVKANKKTDLVKNTDLILDFTDHKLIENTQFSPIFVVWTLAVLVLLLSLGEHYGYIRTLKWFDIPIFILGGLTGLLIVYLVFISNHEVTSPNWNLLWVNPILFLFATNVNITIVNILRRGQIFLILFFIISIPFLKQSIPAEFIPLALILLIRASRPFSFFPKMRKK